jgi:uncharacterized protein YegL
MAIQKLTTKKATSLTPQVVTLIVDDSGSMAGQKAKDVTDAMENMVIAMQAQNQGSGGFRFLLNIAKFGSSTIPLAEAARPETVSLKQLVFTGDSGGTEMSSALTWASQALQNALAECQKIATYSQGGSPNPLVVFFSDGENTGGDVGASADALKAIPFAGGSVDVVAVGVGMSQNAFPIMERIASRPDLAVNIKESELGEFIADVVITVQRGDSPKALVDKYDK